MNFVDRAFEEAPAIENRGRHANRPRKHSADLRGRLESLWDQRPMLSTTDIGVVLGISKNAVIGLRFRMKLPERTTAGPRVKLDRPRRNPRPAVVLIGNLAKDTPPDHSDCAKPFMEIGQNECRYPVSKDGEPFMFCAGASWEDGESYCLRHHTLTHKYTPPKVNAWHGGRAAG